MCLFKKMTLLIMLLTYMLMTSTGCQGGATPEPRPAASPTPYSQYLPGVGGVGVTAEPKPSPTATAVDDAVASNTPVPPPVPKPGYGVQIHVAPGRDEQRPLAWAQGLGVGWVKEQVQWHTIEHGPDDFGWETLDRVVDGADAYGLKVLLTVTHAPDWTRPVEEESGPPSDFEEFGRFMTQLARRYEGRVAAYELWNEPNLAREWRGDELDPARFVALAAQGAAGVRAGDPNALVISGGPAVTGIDDGVIAINDRVFLRGMLDAGITQHVDAIGAHPYGYGNPPEESYRDESHEATSHNDHPTFFFRDTLEDYRGIMVERGAGGHQIWVTEFGWPSPEGIGQMDLSGWEYGREVSEAEQAEYIVRAYHMGDERPWVGPMFLWNLNLAVIWGSGNSFSAYSLLRPDGSYRPAYAALRLAEPLEP